MPTPEFTALAKAAQDTTKILIKECQDRQESMQQIVCSYKSKSKRFRARRRKCYPPASANTSTKRKGHPTANAYASRSHKKR